MNFDAIGPLLVPIIFLVLIYFLLMRPQKKNREAHQDLVRSLESGDNVITAGGICGEVKQVDDDTIVLETEGGTLLKMRKQSVVEKV